MAATKVSKSRKKSFSSFTHKEAFEKLNINELSDWELEFSPVKPSSFFHERLNRLECFNLTSSEAAKELLIDAICEEALLEHQHLRIWKSAPLEGADAGGSVDYLLAQRKGYLDVPLLCAIEAKKDDFEQGEAQCLVAMSACQYQNLQVNRSIDIFGIVTNGTVWQFYKLAIDGKVCASLSHAIATIENILGILDWIFSICERSLLLPLTTGN